MSSSYLDISNSQEDQKTVRDSRHQELRYWVVICQGTKAFVRNTKKFQKPSIRDIESQFYLQKSLLDVKKFGTRVEGSRAVTFDISPQRFTAILVVTSDFQHFLSDLR